MAASAVERLRTQLRHVVVRTPHLGKGRTILVAYSGGQDSTALLHALLDLSRRQSFKVVAAHVDHGLRATSATQAADIRDAARAMGADCIVERVEVGPYRAAFRHASVQQAARSARYQVLAAAAERVGAGAVAVAHTADDQAESVLLHLIRGSGLAGLVGMRLEEWLELPDLGPNAGPFVYPPTVLPERVQVLRPLLQVERGLTYRYCEEAGLPLFEDPSNAQRAYTRNQVRLDLLPVLEALNPNIRGTLARFAELAAEDLDVLRSLTRSRFEALAETYPATDEGVPGIRFSRAALSAEPRALQRRLVREAVRQLTGTEVDLGVGPVDDALDYLVLRPGARGAYALPHGVTLTAASDVVVLHRSTEP